jgi:hypothetical protein
LSTLTDETHQLFILLVFLLLLMLIRPLFVFLLLVLLLLIRMLFAFLLLLKSELNVSVTQSQAANNTIGFITYLLVGLLSLFS